MSLHGQPAKVGARPDPFPDLGPMTWEPQVLPEGTVTFLLTDVEASTSQWGADADAMHAAIGRHYALLDEVVRAHGGARPVEQGEGDSIGAAFARPTDALRAAVDAQRHLAAEPGPTATPLRVRMAIHTGEGRLRDEGNYAGKAIIRTARLRAIAHGGQVVVSTATRDLAVDELAGDVELVDLGVHRLKDLERPERVWQLAHPDLATDFPPLRSLDAIPNNLPVPMSSFVGRFDAIDTVARLVFDNRHVTLTGTGGAGKTRLAQQVAAETLEAFPDGVWWVDLVAVSDPELVPSAISRAAMLPEDRGDPLGGLARRLASRRTLLVLDNCEHLLDPSAEAVATVLTASSGVSVLATSRSALNVPGELTWQVPAMALPVDGGATVDSVAQADAVKLFADRAAQVQSDFRVTDVNAGDVARICQRLDGIPLAIELAAARTRVLSAGEIADALGDAIGLLGGTQRGVAPRHQTIEASIRWSHTLLGPAEQILLRRLAVFAGPFTVDAARSVAADDQLPPGSVLAVLESLVDQSLVQREDDTGPARFRMLVTVRQFARCELDAAGETDALAARHAGYFADRGRSLWPLFEPNMSELLDRADAEFADLVEMLGYLEQHASPEEHAEVAMACLPAMAVRHFAESTVLANQVVPRVDENTVLAGHVHFRFVMVDPSSPDHVEKGLAAAEATGDPDLLLQASFWGNWAAAQDSPSSEALAGLHAGLEQLAANGEGHFSRAHYILAGLERAIGKHDEAWSDWELSLDATICKRCNVMAWSEGALLALARGDLGAARSALDRARDYAFEVRDPGFIAHVRLTEAEIAAYAGGPLDGTVIDAELADGRASGNPMMVGYLSEAEALVRVTEGRELRDASAELAETQDLLEWRWPKRTEARLRRAMIHHALGEHDAAGAAVDDLRVLAREWEAGPWLVAQIDLREASLALDRDDQAEADELAHRALASAASGGFAPIVVSALELIVAIAAQRESYLEAARLAGAARQLRDAIGFRFDPEPEHSRTERAIASARDALGDAAFEAAWDESAQLSLDDAVAYARRARGERKRPSYGWDGLTPTERQVADLAVAGLTNAQIAERLFVGRETVKTHLSNVYAKVGVANRTQLVADAARRGITS
jgi:predicted ATPase/class 3 adenylate cyclase/DNA-binding CsgD family transcriptional regulator